jgi:hypothetical protein
MKREMVDYATVGRTVPRKSSLGVKGHNMNEISFPGSRPVRGASHNDLIGFLKILCSN